MPNPKRQTNPKNKKQVIMKTQEQNTQEVMNYLENSAKNFFESEDGQHWQAIVKLHRLDKYVFIKDGEVNELNMSYYVGEQITEGKTRIKQKIHPVYEPYGVWSKGYGHGPSTKLRAVRWNLAKLELTSTAAQEYYDSMETTKGSV